MAGVLPTNYRLGYSNWENEEGWLDTSLPPSIRKKHRKREKPLCPLVCESSSLVGRQCARYKYRVSNLDTHWTMNGQV